MKFKQVAVNFDRHEYTIESTGLHINKKGLGSSSDLFIEFEEIGSKIITQKSSKVVWLILAIFFFIITIAVFAKRLSGGGIGEDAETFHLVVGTFFLIIFLMTRTNSIYLVQSGNASVIEFIGTKRYKQKVDAFIVTLLQRRDEYLLNKYATLNDFLPYNQQHNNLVWLYNLNLLSKEELQMKINELDNIKNNNGKTDKNQPNKVIGFKRNDANNQENNKD